MTEEEDNCQCQGCRIGRLEKAVDELSRKMDELDIGKIAKEIREAKK